MEWACVNGVRARATPQAVGICPSCKLEVVAKCGEVNRWHWSHLAGDCDPWAEGETSWHINWKHLFPPEWQEVAVSPHRADIKTPKLVIELQHSPINPATIREREQFYGDMVWLFDLRKVMRNITIFESDHSAHRPYVPLPLKQFAWRRARRSWFACTKPVLVALARGELYNIFGFGFYSGLNFCGGFARRLTKEQFLASVGAETPQAGEEPIKLSSFNSLPSPEVAKDWQPYWDDERAEHWKKPVFAVSRFKQEATNPIRVVQLPMKEGSGPQAAPSV